MDKRRILVGGIVAAAACAALVRAARPGAGGEAPALAALPFSSPAAAGALRARPGPARTASPAPVVVYVAGEVRRPGVYRLPASARVDDAVRAAGGQGPAADPVAVNLAEPLRDGEEIVVPVRGAEPVAAPARASAAAPRRRRRSAVAHGGPARTHARSGRRGRKEPPQTPVDVNAADAAQLESVPGIGPRLAQRIVEFRESNGPFASADELLDVNGVSERLLDEISPYVSFGK